MLMHRPYSSFRSLSRPAECQHMISVFFHQHVQTVKKQERIMLFMNFFFYTEKKKQLNYFCLNRKTAPLAPPPRSVSPLPRRPSSAPPALGHAGGAAARLGCTKPLRPRSPPVFSKHRIKNGIKKRGILVFLRRFLGYFRSKSI